MTKARENLTEQLKSVLSSILTTHDGDITIKPELVASRAYTRLDRKRRAPALVQWGCVLELRQLAREMLRENHDPVAHAHTEQIELFEGLQQRYPCKDGGYVMREHLSLADRRWNATRMRKSADSLQAHADALDAETDRLVQAGLLDQSA